MPSSQPPKRPTSGPVNVPAEELYRMRQLLAEAMERMPSGDERSAVFQCRSLIGEYVAPEEEAERDAHRRVLGLDFGRHTSRPVAAEDE